jgi:hypothetical protein
VPRLGKYLRDLSYVLHRFGQILVDLAKPLGKLANMAVNTCVKCEICGQEFATPAALGSHKRSHQKKGKDHAVNNSDPVTVRILVEQAPVSSSFQSNPYRCPECGDELSLAGDGVGNYSFRCLRCYEGGQ